MSELIFSIVLRLPRIRLSKRAKYALIFLGATSSVGGLYFFDVLSIETLLLTWNLFIILFIITWEKGKRYDQTGDFSNDERWSKLKREISEIEKKLQKTTDQTKKQTLRKNLVYLRGELRRLEFAISESSANAAYNAQRGSLKKIDRDSEHRFEKYARDKIPQAEETPEQQIESEKEERGYLEKIVDNAEAIIRGEPTVSRSSALVPVANDLRAHYNVIRKRDKNASTLSDYWLSWLVINSTANQTQIKSSYVKYASNTFRPRIVKLMDLVGTLNLPVMAQDSIQSERNSFTEMA